MTGSRSRGTGSLPSRRSLLAALGAAGVAGLAGCDEVGDALSGGGGCPDYDPVETANARWTSRMGDPAGTATVAPGAAPDPDLSIEWTFPLPTHVGHHVPVVADGTVYAHDMDGWLYGIDAESGESRWRVPVSRPRRAPAVGDGTLVVLTERRIEAFAAATGERRWSALDLHPHLFDARPVVAGGTVYAMVGVATHALDLETGEVRWRSPTGLPSRSTPAVADGTVYVAGDDAYVRALSTADGAERWRAKLDARVRCNVSVADGTVCTATTDGTVVAFDAADGSERWRHRLPDPIGSLEERPRTVNTDGARVYVTAEEDLFALSAESGERCWRSYDYRGSYASGVAVGDGHVFAPTFVHGAGLTTFDAASGDAVEEWEVGDDPHFEVGPAVADGALYWAGDGAVGRFA